MDILSVLITILVGAGSGAIAAVIGYIKGAKLETFNTIKFVTTIIIGAGIGGFAAFSGQSIVSIEAILASTPILIGATYFVENIIKTIYRRLIKK